MRIRKNFSSISDLEERAFCEGYMYAQKEFADKEEADEESKYGKLKKNIAAAGIGSLTGYGAYKLREKVTDKLDNAKRLKRILQEPYEADLDRLKKDVLNNAQRGGDYTKIRALESGKGILDLEKSGMLNEAEKERLNYLRDKVHGRLKTVEGLEKKARNWQKAVIGGGFGIAGTAALAKGLYDYKNRNKE